MPAAPMLLTIQDAAALIGVPVEPFERVASERGFIIKIGSAKRIKPDELGELIEACRDRPKVLASTSESEKGARPSGSSKTKAALRSRPARRAADKLKQSSPNTSNKETASVVPLKPQT